MPGLYWLDPSGVIFKPNECGTRGGAGVTTFDHTQIFLSIFESKVAPPRLRSPDKLPEDGAVVFGRSGILKLYWPNAPEMTPTVDEQEE